MVRNLIKKFTLCGLIVKRAFIVVRLDLLLFAAVVIVSGQRQSCRRFRAVRVKQWLSV